MTENQGQEKPKRVDFFELPWVRKHRLRLQVWAAVRKARRDGITSAPTIEAILGRPAPRLDPDSKEAKSQDLQYWDQGEDSQLGRWVKDLEVLIPTSKKRQMSPEQIIFLEVDKILERKALQYVPALLRIYPLFGVYHEGIPERTRDEIRADEAIERAVIRILDGEWR